MSKNIYGYYNNICVEKIGTVTGVHTHHGYTLTGRNSPPKLYFFQGGSDRHD